MWLGAMKLRNNLAHNYNSALAYKSVDIIVCKYVDFF